MVRRSPLCTNRKVRNCSGSDGATRNSTRKRPASRSTLVLMAPWVTTLKDSAAVAPVSAAELKTLKGEVIKGDIVSLSDKEIVLEADGKKVATPIDQVLTLSIKDEFETIGPDTKFALVELTDIAPTLMELAGLPVPARMQGRSLLPLLTGAAPPDRHRDFVRCEYYDALDEPHRSYGTMYRDRRWKLIVYHDVGLGELYDLENDPHEFDSLWDSPAHQGIKLDLLARSFDASVRAMDYGPARVMPY